MPNTDKEDVFIYLYHSEIIEIENNITKPESVCLDETIPFLNIIKQPCIFLSCTLSVDSKSPKRHILCLYCTCRLAGWRNAPNKMCIPFCVYYRAYIRKYTYHGQRIIGLCLLVWGINTLSNLSSYMVPINIV